MPEIIFSNLREYEIVDYERSDDENLHLTARVQRCAVNFTIDFGPDEVQDPVVTESSPLSVDDSLFRIISVIIPDLHVLQFLHVTGIRSSS